MLAGHMPAKLHLALLLHANSVQRCLSICKQHCCHETQQILQSRDFNSRTQHGGQITSEAGIVGNRGDT